MTGEGSMAPQSRSAPLPLRGGLGRGIGASRRRRCRYCGRHGPSDCLDALYWPDESLLAVADLLSRKARASRGAGSCCRPTTRPRRSPGFRYFADYEPRVVIALGEISMMAADPHACRRPIARRSPRSSAAATGSGSPAIMTPIHPTTSVGPSRRRSARPAHLPPRALARCAGRRDRRTPASRGARRAAWPRGRPPLLRH